jgi:hypothetical protein
MSSAMVRIKNFFIFLVFRTNRFTIRIQSWCHKDIHVFISKLDIFKNNIKSNIWNKFSYFENNPIFGIYFLLTWEGYGFGKTHLRTPAWIILGAHELEG